MEVVDLKVEAHAMTEGTLKATPGKNSVVIGNDFVFGNFFFNGPSGKNATKTKKQKTGLIDEKYEEMPLFVAYVGKDRWTKADI